MDHNDTKTCNSSLKTSRSNIKMCGYPLVSNPYSYCVHNVCWYVLRFKMSVKCTPLKSISFRPWCLCGNPNTDLKIKRSNINKIIPSHIGKQSSVVVISSEWINPLTAERDYSRFNPFYWPPKSQLLGTKCVLEHPRFANDWSKIIQIWVIFTHLKLWVAIARHNFKWVKIWII